MSKEVKELVDHLFRFKAGQMTATLTRIFGFENSDLVENVVNEAMAKALKVWRFDELPDNPEGWLYVTAKNLALDHLRRESKWNQKREILEQELQVFKEKPEEVELQIFEDDQLKMIFMCCHPELAPEVRVALTLKSLCGFHASEIANAFLDKTTTIEQRLVRAKKKILEQKLEMDLPHNELDQRVDSVLDTLYLFFNEGYSASRGDSLLRRELCLEAIRLTEILSRHMLGRRPSVYALLALFHLQFSRFDARVGTSGELLLLEEQDRSLWNQTSLVKGFSYLELGMQAEELSTYHLEAGIAACHSAATCFQDTDWGSIVDYYEILQELNPTPVVRLNRAVAIGMKDGAKAAIEQLEGLGEISSLANYYLYPLALGEFYRRDKQWELSRVYYEKALNLVSNDSERQYLETKIESLGDCAKV